MSLQFVHSFSHISRFSLYPDFMSTISVKLTWERNIPVFHSKYIQMVCFPLLGQFTGVQVCFTRWVRFGRISCSNNNNNNNNKNKNKNRNNNHLGTSTTTFCIVFFVPFLHFRSPKKSTLTFPWGSAESNECQPRL